MLIYLIMVHTFYSGKQWKPCGHQLLDMLLSMWREKKELDDQEMVSVLEQFDMFIPINAYHCIFVYSL